LSLCSSLFFCSGDPRAPHSFPTRRSSDLAWRESSLQPVGAGVGFEFAPFSHGGVVSFGSAVDTGEWVWNDGNASSAPVFTVWADSPGFAVSVGDKRVTYPWPTFQDVPVTVDMAGSGPGGGAAPAHL